MRKVETPVDMMPYHPDLDTIDEYDFVNDCFIEEGDIASQPWECIQTYDRKKLKMKKHRRQKLKKLLYNKLKWIGKI